MSIQHMGFQVIGQNKIVHNYKGQRKSYIGILTLTPLSKIQCHQMSSDVTWLINTLYVCLIPVLIELFHGVYKGTRCQVCWWQHSDWMHFKGWQVKSFSRFNLKERLWMLLKWTVQLSLRVFAKKLNNSLCLSDLNVFHITLLMGRGKQNVGDNTNNL